MSSRWNIEEIEGGIRVCRSDHQWSDECDWVEYVPKAEIERLTSENERLRAELFQMTQAVGLASTIAGEVQMNVSDPVAMMQEVCASVAAERQRARLPAELVERLKEEAEFFGRFSSHHKTLHETLLFDILDAIGKDQP